MGKHEQQPISHKHDDDVLPAPRGDAGSAKIKHKLDPDAAWPRVQAVLAGHKKDLNQLPLLVTFLDGDQQQALWNEHYDELMKLGGDHVLDVTRALGNPAATVTAEAFQAKPKVTADKLRTYLRSVPAKELAGIENYTDIRSVLTGKLIEELPEVLHHVPDTGKNPQLVRWLADTTNINLLATLFAQHGTEELAKSLDAENLWAWLDHVPSGPGFMALAALRRGTTNQAIKDKIATVQGPMATDDGDVMEKVRDEGGKELAAALDDDKIDRAKLMDIAGRAGERGKHMSFPRIVKLIRKAKLSADDVVTLLLSLDIEVKQGLPALLDTDGVTKSHVISFVAGRYDLIESLRDDKVRKAIKGKLGKTVGLRDLLMNFYGAEQQAVLDDQALRKWYFEDATPDDLLVLCASDSDRAGRMCRIVKREHNMDWVYQLSPGADTAALRVLATHCGDQKLSAFIRDTLIADETSSKPAIVGAAPEDPRVFGDEKTRLEDAEKSWDPDDVLARLADMDDKQRATLAGDHVALPKVLKQVGRENRLRALSLLDVPFAPTVAYAAPDSGFDRQLVLHLRSRPAAEEETALSVKAVVERAIFHVHPDPLQTFPSLHEPKVLAKAIDLCPALVERILTGTESSRALSLLSHQDVRKKFEAILEQKPELIDQLPRYQHLDAKAQKKVDKISEELKPGEAVDALGEVQDGTYDGDHRRDADAAVEKKARDKSKTSVADAIKVLANEGGETTGAMALIAEHHDEIVTMLDDGTKWPVIEKLAHLVDLPPDQVFNVGLDRLLMMRNARRWLFELVPGFVLLHDLRSAKAPAFTQVASDVNRDMPGAMNWLERLPVGAGLTDREEITLDTIQIGLTNELPLQTLFKVRFGIQPPALDAAGLKSTYTTLARLPDAHVQQQRIKEIKLDKPKGEEAGSWSGSEIMIEEHLKPGDATETMAPRSDQMTREQVRKAYGWDDATINKHVADGRLEEKQVAGQTVYELPNVELDKYTQVLLHEIGHSVDSILGTQTEVVFGMAGWRQYDEGDFDRWATEMGGWDKVTKDDQSKIRQAWLDALKSNRGVTSMVDLDHPARGKKYEGVGIVDGVRAGNTGLYSSSIAANGRTFIMQPYYGYFYSLNGEAASTAPSTASLYAPAEYFAELYVEYYRLVDGTPAGNKLKGGLLPAPIKKWFDGHVDKVRFDPKRLEKPEETA